MGCLPFPMQSYGLWMLTRKFLALKTVKEMVFVPNFPHSSRFLMAIHRFNGGISENIWQNGK